MEHMTYYQQVFNDSIVDIDLLFESSKLTPKNKIILENDAVYYAALSSRNLEHLKALKNRNMEMKQLLDSKTRRIGQ